MNDGGITIDWSVIAGIAGLKPAGENLQSRDHAHESVSDRQRERSSVPSIFTSNAEKTQHVDVVFQGRPLLSYRDRLGMRGRIRQSPVRPNLQ